jgi:hypothetical protein
VANQKRGEKEKNLARNAEFQRKEKGKRTCHVHKGIIRGLI